MTRNEIKKYQIRKWGSVFFSEIVHWISGKHYSGENPKKTSSLFPLSLTIKKSTLYLNVCNSICSSLLHCVEWWCLGIGYCVPVPTQVQKFLIFRIDFFFCIIVTVENFDWYYFMDISFQFLKLLVNDDIRLTNVETCKIIKFFLFSGFTPQESHRE